MDALIRAVLRHPGRVAAIWALLLACAAGLAIRLPDTVQGSSGNIEDSESGRVAERMQRQFGPGSAYLFVIVVQSDHAPIEDARFAGAVGAISRALVALPGVTSADHYWNTGAPELLGRDGRSAMVLVRPSASSFFEAENQAAVIRSALAAEQTPGITVSVTGMPALFHDLNRNASADLLRAERIGIPLTLLILLIVFGAPLAALLPLAIALVSVTIASAGLYLSSGALPVSAFARNAVAMIGLAVGVDYALFLLARFRSRLGSGDPVPEAVLRASLGAGRAVLVSGAAVGIGFAGLLLVKAEFLHSIALGGVLVVASAVAATLTLLPVLLAWLGRGVNWPRATRRARPDGAATRAPSRRWAVAITESPWRFLLLALAVAAALAAPSLRMKPANANVKDLAPEFEARAGFEALQRNFEAGWMGPVVLLFEAREERGLEQESAQRAIHAITARLAEDRRVARIQVDPRRALSPDGRTASLAVVMRHAPDAAESLAFVQALRADRWPEAAEAGLVVRIGGPTAMIQDFDAELFGSLSRVIPAVLGLTFVVLMIAFRSLVVPAKAIALNLLCVVAAYGFLVLVFQDGVGASWLGIDPPGGLTSLVVLMLFTILFGVSMDYEVFLLRQIQEEHVRCADNRRAVQSGVERSASLITSAAAIMVVLFASFGFTRFTATREFGLGLAFAVALDATLIRLVMAPALMALFGAANWWWPRERGWAWKGPQPDEKHEGLHSGRPPAIMG